MPITALVYPGLRSPATVSTFTAPFPKTASRWLSLYQFTPQAIEFTSQDDIDGGLSWLVGATLDFSFTRALCAPYYLKVARNFSSYSQPLVE